MRGFVVMLGLSMGCAPKAVPVVPNVSSDHPMLAPEAPEELRRAADLVARGDVVGAEALVRTLLPVPTDPEKEAMEALEEALARYGEGDVEAAAVLLRTITSTYPRSQGATHARRLLDDVAVVGKPAGTLDVVRWFQGEARPDAAVTLLVFWEAWCPHCQREVPRLQALADGFAPQQLQVIGITKMTRGTTDADVDAFVEAHGVTYPLALEDGALTDRYDILGVPSVAVLADGKVAWKGHPALLSPGLFFRLLDAPEP